MFLRYNFLFVSSSTDVHPLQPISGPCSIEKYPSLRMANRYTRIFDAGGPVRLDWDIWMHIFVPCPAGCKESFLNQIFVISLQHLSGKEETSIQCFRMAYSPEDSSCLLATDRSVIFKTTRRAQSLQRHERSKREATSLSKASLCEPQDHCWSPDVPSDG